MTRVFSDAITNPTNNRHVILRAELDFAARRAFVAEATSSITAAAGSGRKVQFDCSAVEVHGPVEDSVVGMLVTLARTAQRNGARLALTRVPAAMGAQLEAAGVAHFFDWER
jgi:anti-anti-sigma regulatory factor